MSKKVVAMAKYNRTLDLVAKALILGKKNNLKAAAAAFREALSETDLTAAVKSINNSNLYAQQLEARNRRLRADADEDEVEFDGFDSDIDFDGGSDDVTAKRIRAKLEDDDEDDICTISETQLNAALDDDDEDDFATIAETEDEDEDDFSNVLASMRARRARAR